MQLLVCCSTILGQGRCIYGVAIRSFVDAIERRTSSDDALVWATSLEPDSAGNGVRNVGLRRCQIDRPLRVLDKLVTLRSHPAGFVARWNFLVESRHQLDVAISSNEGTEGALNYTVERARDKAVGLSEHDHLVAALVGVRLYPDTVFLIRTSRPGVLHPELVGPGNAFIPGTKSERTLTAVATDNIRQGVGLCLKDWRVRTVFVLELCVNGDAVQWNVSVIDSRSRVALRAGRIHVTRYQALTNTVCISQVGSLGDAATGDHVGINHTILIDRWRGRILIRNCWSFLLSKRDRLREWRYQRKRQCGCSNRGATTRFI